MRPIRIKGDPPLFDIGTHARAAPMQRGSLTSAEIVRISRTVARSPEVMVKVTSGKGSNTTRGVSAHFDYISRAGKLEIETDDGERLMTKDAGAQLINNWDLDLEEARHQRGLFASHRRKPPKLVRKIILSMPAGTPPVKVMAAVREFARDQFWLKHRYALVLHTNEPHPHVHLTVKAVSEAGLRLDIRRSTLRYWREEFARHLRTHGVDANATPRVIRGQSRESKLDAIVRAAQRGESSHMAARAHEVARELKDGRLDKSGAARLQRTRRDILNGWLAVRELLAADGHHQLADQVATFLRDMPPPRTEKQWIAADQIDRARDPRTKDNDPVR